MLQFQCAQIFLTYIQTNFFTIVSLVSSGAAMWYTGLYIKFAPSGGYTSYLQLYQFRVTMFSGCLVSVLFLVRWYLFSCQRNCVILSFFKGENFCDGILRIILCKSRISLAMSICSGHIQCLLLLHCKLHDDRQFQLVRDMMTLGLIKIELGFGLGLKTSGLGQTLGLAY